MAAPAAPQRLPFQLFTREIPEFVANVPFALGGRQVVQLDNVGYANYLLLHVKGTVTVATADLFLNPGFPWNVLSNILVQPPGLLPPFNMGGFMTRVFGLAGKFFAPFVDGADFAAQGLDTNAWHASNVDVAPVVVGTNTWSLWLVVPFARSSMDVRGIVAMGSKARTDLTLTFAAASDICTVPANLTGTNMSIDIYQAYYPDAPAGANADPDPNWLITYEEFQQPVSATGDNPVNIEPNETILGIAHLVALNGAADQADIQYLTLRFNKSYFLNRLQGEAWEFIQSRRLGFPLPQGVVLYDFDRFVDDGALDVRDWAASADIQTVQSTISIASGATIGTSPYIRTAVRRLVDLGH